MYKVLIVDDEVLILSGIKYLLDWESIDCRLVGTANNGEQALALMDELQPDIVISDINMPLMNGIDLLKKSSELHPFSTFIMLTCLEEFSLVKEALQYQAVDYLLKSELHAKSLQASVEKAKAESDMRKQYLSLEVDGVTSREQDSKTVTQILSQINVPKTIDPKELHYLCSKNILTNYFVLQINIEYPFGEGDERFVAEDFKKVYEYQGELNTRLIKSHFSDMYQLEVSNPAPFAYVYFIHNVSKAKYESKIDPFVKKLSAVSQDVTGVKSYLLATRLYGDYKEIEACKQELTLLRDSFFNIERSIVGAHTIEPLEFKPIIFQAYIDRLGSALKARNMNDFRYYMNKVSTKLVEYHYTRGEAIVFLDQLIANALVHIKIELANGMGTHFQQDALPYLPTKSLFLRFIRIYNRVVESVLISYVKEKDCYVQKAKNYIHENVTNRIMLDDVANEIGVSSGYLSSLFSKQCEVSMIEYINKVKVDKAITLMRQRPYKIYEICNELGFDNSYYFSRVFKKQTGKTLSSFMNSIIYE